jgi:hypothetical protein
VLRTPRSLPQASLGAASDALARAIRSTSGSSDTGTVLCTMRCSVQCVTDFVLIPEQTRFPYRSRSECPPRDTRRRAYSGSHTPTHPRSQHTGPSGAPLPPSALYSPTSPKRSAARRHSSTGGGSPSSGRRAGGTTLYASSDGGLTLCCVCTLWCSVVVRYCSAVESPLCRTWYCSRLRTVE